MKAVLKVLLFMFITFFLCLCRKDEPSLVVNIPDDNFLNALIELGVDTNGDGSISPSEAEAVQSLDVSEKSISDMTGIEAFVNLGSLTCWGNNLSTLDVSNNILLTSLNCSGNQISTLNVSHCEAIRFLNIHFNKLTNLDVSDLIDLHWLDCDDNQLTTLDVSNNISLTGLSCDHNQLTTLDLSNQYELHHLECGSNQLTRLDVSNNSKLGTVYIGYLCLVIDYMPSLQEVCVWTMPFPPEGLNITTEGSPNVYFTTDCK